MWSPLVDVDHTEIELNDLDPYSHYEVKVWAVTMAGHGRTAVASGFTLPAG